MPRDLSELKPSASENMPQLTRSPEEVDENEHPPIGPTIASPISEDGLFSQLAERNTLLDELHPYTQTLSINDLESCVRIEEATFPPQERASREKLEYRLRKCGELCMGIFISQEGSNGEIATAETASPVYSGAPTRKAILIGQVICTKGASDVVTDADMSVPSSNSSVPPVGHREDGRTLCIHSFAVLPAYQGRGVGKTLLKAYLQRMGSQGVGARAALLAHADMVPFYEKMGFRNVGENASQFGGGGWLSMVVDLEDEDEEEFIEEFIEEVDLDE